jgi:hypothetical protein
VPFELPINMNSAMLVRDELNKSLATTVQYVDAWLGEPSDAQLLEQAITELHQINGILRVVEFNGAIELSSALLQACQALSGQKLVLDEPLKGELVRDFSILRSFIDVSIKAQKISPLTVNEAINGLHARLRLPMVYEAQQVSFGPARCPEFSEADEYALSSDESAKVKRLGHMYQVGLLAVLRNKNVAANFHLMERAISRLRQDFPALAGEQWWLLVSTALQLMRAGALRPTLSRKRLLAAVDADLRRRCRANCDAAMVLPDLHRDQLLYLVALSGDEGELPRALCAQYGLPAVEFTDTGLAERERALSGGSDTALNAVAAAIADELQQLKQLLEVNSNDMTVEVAGTVAARLQKIAEILGQAGFNRLKGLLIDTAFQFNQSMAAGVTDRDAMQLLAEALLMVENTLSEPGNFDDQALSAEQPGAAMLARTILDEATGVVINESKSAIGLAKRGITAYLESNFDAAHVSNVGTSLAMVQGAFSILGHARAAAVLKQCINHIEHLGVQSAAEQSRQSVETLADALISIEYYLAELSISEQQNCDLLAIAEESVSELGFAA